MTFLELYGRELDAVLGSSDTRLFTLVKRKAAINAAQDEFNARTKCFIRQTSIPLSVSPLASSSFNLITAIGDDYVMLAPKDLPSIIGVRGGTTVITVAAGKDFPQRSIGWLDRNQPGWREGLTEPGTPTSWHIYRKGGQEWIEFDHGAGSPSDEEWALLVPHVGVPETMEADLAEPFTDESGNVATHLRLYHRALALWAGYLLEPLRKNVAGQRVHKAEFEAMVDQYLVEPAVYGEQHVQMARDYLGEANARRSFGDLGDPRR